MPMRIWHQSFIVLEDVPAYTDRVRQHIDRVKQPVKSTFCLFHFILPSVPFEMIDFAQV